MGDAANKTRLAGPSPANVIGISRRKRKALKSNRGDSRPTIDSSHSRSRPSIRGTRHSRGDSHHSLGRNLDSLGSRRSLFWLLGRHVRVRRFHCRTRRTSPS